MKMIEERLTPGDLVALMRDDFDGDWYIQKDAIWYEIEGCEEPYVVHPVSPLHEDPVLYPRDSWDHWLVWGSTQGSLATWLHLCSHEKYLVRRPA